MTPTTNDVVDQAARVFCDASIGGTRWNDHSESSRQMLRARMRVVAAAGLLADGDAQGERDQAIADRNRWRNLAAEWERVAHDAKARIDEAVQTLYDHVAADDTAGPKADIDLLDQLRAVLSGLPTSKDQT